MRRSYPLALGSPAHGPLQTFDDAYAIALGADTPGGGLVWDFSRAEGAVLRHGTDDGAPAADDGGNSLSDLRLVDDATSEIIRSCISPASAAGGATPTAAGASPRAVAAAAAAAAADDDE